MTLRDAIARWDGTSVATIGSVFERYGDKPRFASSLVKLLGDAACELGATWLLKKHLESGGRLSGKTTSQLWTTAGAFKEWGSKLHVLQSMVHLTVPERDKKCVEALLRECLNDKNKFVRAWAYSGFYELAAAHPEYRDEAGVLLMAGLEEEAPSVRARIRRLMKEREPLE